MDLDLEQGHPVLVDPIAADAAVGPGPAFDPVRLELGEAGDDGIRLVFSKYWGRVERFFRKKGVPPDQAQDLTQETFLRVFRGEAKLESRAELEAWLFEIARNVRSNSIRTKMAQKRAATEISLDELHPGGEVKETAAPALVAQERDALGSAIAREQIGALRRALAELPEQMRQCVLLRVRDDLKYKEVAEVMKISIETVKSQLHEAKGRLRPLLERYFAPIEL
jgi:RNA polymerase sigma-70 factor (ECF subfamily)